jgi:hypothetical protein
VALAGASMSGRFTEVSKFEIRPRSLNSQPNLDFIDLQNLVVICNDAGGAAHIASMLKTYGIHPLAHITGPAEKIFLSFGVSYTAVDFQNIELKEKTILLGSGLYGGPESLALENPGFAQNKKVVLLDHWENYRERFHPSGEILPAYFIVTNRLARNLAKAKFPTSEVVEIPDFQLALTRLEFSKLTTRPHAALILLEPTSETSSNQKFQQISLELLINEVEKIATNRDIDHIVFRPHPSQSLDQINDLLKSVKSKLDLRLSLNYKLVEDLALANFVVGFHTYALLLASELNITTYGFFAHHNEHWSNSFPQIQSFSRQ